MKNRSKIYIVILICLLAIGFAAVTANLIINSNANISSNPDDFDVYFYSANTDEGGTATINPSTRREITFTTKELKSIGDKAILTYEIKNGSSQYDADITMSISLDENYRNYVRITYETFNDSDTINILAKEIKQGKITIELLKPVIEDLNVTYIVTFTANAIERTETAYDNYTVRFNGNGATYGEMDNQVISHNETVTLNTNRFVKDGYQFVGWSEESNPVLVDYKNLDNVTNLVDDNSIVDLYAVWLKNDYTYTGDYESLKIPVSGKYKLEVWGASGDSYNSTYRGGYGAYSVGVIDTQANTDYYIAVGGAGNSYYGGYNGGGEAQNHSSSHCFGGGGATHIATVPGQLQDLESYKGTLVNNSYYVSDYIIIVGSGGGGACQYNNSTAGDGGGIQGKRVTSSQSTGYSVQGTQTAGGTSTNWSGTDNANRNGGFGRGAMGPNYAGGGGAGFYGGGSAYSQWSVSVAGGSGYIASSKLISYGNITKHMACYSCSGNMLSSVDATRTINASGVNASAIGDYAKSGNGYARITYLGQ